MSDCTDWWHSVILGPGSVLPGRRYTRKPVKRAKIWLVNVSQRWWRFCYSSVLIQVIFSAQHNFLAIIRIFHDERWREYFSEWWWEQHIFTVSNVWLGVRAVPRGPSVCTGWVVTDKWPLYISISTRSLPEDAKPALGKGVPFLARSFRFATQTHQLPRPCLRLQPQFQPQPQIQPNLKFNMTPLPFPSTSTSKLTFFSTTTIQADIPQLIMCAEKDAKCQIILSEITQACWQIWTVCCNLPSPGRSQSN